VVNIGSGLWEVPTSPVNTINLIVALGCGQGVWLGSGYHPYTCLHTHAFLWAKYPQFPAVCLLTPEWTRG